MKQILFNTQMVKAILEDRKTATRRLVKPQPDLKHQYPLGYVTDSTDKNTVGCFGFGIDEYGGSIQYARPPYKPGDILYVRETWHTYIKRVGKGETCHLQEFYGYKASIANSEDASEKWKPSIHMPKEAARIFLKVKSVRVERLQEITEEQAIKEGCQAGSCQYNGAIWGQEDTDEWTAVEAFQELWNSTIKKADFDTCGWNASPYVWVIEFERCDKPTE